MAEQQYMRPGDPVPAELPPAPDAIGWCHNCEGWQLGSQTRRLYMPWAGRYEWACRECDDEPWGLGVWLGDQCQTCRPIQTAWAEAKKHSYGSLCRAGSDVADCGDEE